MTVDSSTVLIDGPWRHQLVPANGARFHVALAGPDDRDAPLVVLVHGFPQLWWAWRHQLPALGDAGYRVAALDLRGTGASDKPPHGYDVPTLTRDVAAVVRSLGTDQAVVVGQGSGGEVAWATAALQAPIVRALGVLSAPHPLRARAAPRGGLRNAAARHLAFFQLPYLPERALTRSDLVPRLLREWGAPDWLEEDVATTYRLAAQVPFAAHSAMEQARWLVRSTPRMDGRRYLAALKTPVRVPVLQLHGAVDRCRPPTHARATDHPDTAPLVGLDYRFEVVRGAGHFLAEEAPDEVTGALLGWLREVAPT